MPAPFPKPFAAAFRCGPDISRVAPAVPAALTAIARAAVLALALPASLAPAEVAIDDELLLGVWSPQRTRFLATVPACVTQDADEAPAAYRITVTGGAPGGRYAMSDDAGDEIPYRLRWYDDIGAERREQLRPGEPSRRTYRFRTRAECAAGEASGLEARARGRDVERAPPGIYRDLLTLTVSPI